MSTDRLRQQCGKMLASDEEILLDAECRLFHSKTKSLFGRAGYGRAFLTGRRLIWIKRRALAIEHLLPRRLPDVVESDFLSIERMRLLTGGLGLSGLEVTHDDFRYAYHLGRGPFPFMFWNSRTTREWFGAVKLRLAEAGREVPVEIVSTFRIERG